MSKSQFVNNEDVMFFGGSFTYCDGVEDYETLPYLFQEISQGQYQAYKFGFSDYGAYHTLLILESGLGKRD